MNRGTTPFLSRVSPWRHGRTLWLAPVVAVLLAAWSRPVAAQMGGFGFGGAVGGIAIDTDGIIRNLDAKALENLAAERRRVLAGMQPARGKTTATRKVSLARVVEAVRTASAEKPLPADVLFLGGLERVTHVFVDPDAHDIVLMGPGDSATVDAAGTVVAVTSGRPLLLLEDLMVALRAIDASRSGGMKCSIDPTAEGIVRLQALLRSQKRMGPNPDATLVAMQNAVGPQRVTVGGVPGDSRFARVLVAADYRLKRIGMGLEPSGLAELPSYLSVVPPGSTSASTLPRFWLEPDYEPISRDPDELAWRINGRRMRCRTENDLFATDGTRSGRAAADATAEQWCERMTTNYEKLSGKHPVFSELLNCVDLAVVAALIHGRQLSQRAGVDLAPLLDENAVPLPSYEVPTTVPTVANGIKKGNQWVISASGGVLFQPWSFATNTTDSADAAVGRTAALAGRPNAGCCWD